ncbi:MAG TPA: LuxR C-terminal-related transcriptional regulator [Thermoleophilaceae bacterium]
MVPRSNLVARLAGAADVPLSLLVAPAGYGKTTLLGEWGRSSRRPFAWVLATEADNDPSHFARSIAEALAAAGITKKNVAAKLPGAVAQPARSFVLAIDRAEALRSPGSMQLLRELIERLAPGSRIAVASRSEPQLGLGTLRAEGLLLELRATDLAMSVREASALVSAHGLALDREDLELLVHRTEGWPAALALAVLAALEERSPARALATFSGSDRFIGDYIEDELLGAFADADLAFLRRASVLDRLSGPTCDRVLERADSARMLKRLSRMNAMLIPLDRADDEFRCHRLFAQALQADLRHEDPGSEPGLHARASEWFAEHGDVERSIAHAAAAGDPDRAGELLWEQAADLLGWGRTAQVGRWLRSFGDAGVAGSPTLALTAAAQAFMAGERSLVEHWASLAGQGAVEPYAQLLRSAAGEDRVAQMGELAESAVSGMAEESPWLALGYFLQGVSSHLTGGREAARASLEEGARRAAASTPIIQALCLSQLALLASERRDGAAAESLAARAKAQVERSGTSEYPIAALVLAVSASVEAQLGRVEASKADAREAERLLSLVADFSAWYEAECRLALARAALRLGDSRQAQQLLEDTDAYLERASDAAVAVAWLKECRAQVNQSAATSAGRDWSLTTAELRVLQFLPTHLSFPEIAERLYVSSNTVKTHARAVYRKLDASSRGEAVLRAREAGLLDEASHTGVGHAALDALS